MLTILNFIESLSFGYLIYSKLYRSKPEGLTFDKMKDCLH